MSNLRKEFDSKIRKAYLNENNICECENVENVNLNHH